MKQPHKHAELIKAWADGAVIQFKIDSHWKDCHNNKPDWDYRIEYRIKPELPDIEKYDVEAGDIWFIHGRYVFVLGVSKNNDMEDGWAVQFNTGFTSAKKHLARIEAKLIFRRGVIDRLNEL